MNKVKICGKCRTEKSVVDFHKDKSKKYGVSSSCKTCAIEISHKYYLKNAIGISKKVSKYAKSYVPLYNRDIESRLRNLCTKAKHRTKEFNLVESDLLDLWGKQGGQCAYTKLPLLATANQFNTVSLDRVDSSIGYVVGNIQLVCSAINKMKQEYSEDLFILLSHLVTQNNKLSDLPDVMLARYFPLDTSENNVPNKVSLCSGVECI